MTPPADSDTQRAIGRIEGQLTGIIATLVRQDSRAQSRDELLQEIDSRTAAVEEKVKVIPKLANDVSNIQQMARDGKMTGKGVMLGFGLATAAGGATLATVAKQIWLALTGA